MATKYKKSGAKISGPKSICQNRDCLKMGKHLSEAEFYKSRNASIGHHPFCKECVNNSINIDNLQTIYDVLKILDTPFIADIWEEILQEDTDNYLGSYLKKINFSYRKKYEDARWKNSIFTNDEDKVFLEPDEDSEIAVWDEEWQGEYNSSELKYLNDYYNDLKKDFKIITRNHKDYAKKIAQASLVVNNAYNAMRKNPEDKEAVNTYKTASSNFDMLSKSAQFAESQRGANDVSLGCFGRVFDAVEKHNWVPQHIPDDEDLFDKIINQFANIKKSL